MKDIALQLYLVGGVAAGAAIIALLGIAVRRGIARVGWDKGQAVLTQAWRLVATVAGEANSELRAKLLAATAEDSDGGKEVTRAEWDAAVDSAVAKFKRLYGADSLKKLAAAIGVNLDFLDEWIGAEISSAINVPPPPAPSSAALSPAFTSHAPDPR